MSSAVHGADGTWPLGWSAEGFEDPRIRDSGPMALVLGEQALYVARGMRVVAYDPDGDALREMGRSEPLPGVIRRLAVWTDADAGERFVLAVQDRAVWLLDVRDPFAPTPWAVLRPGLIVDLAVHEDRLYVIGDVALSVYALDADGQPARVFQHMSPGRHLFPGVGGLYVMRDEQRFDVWDWDREGSEPIRARGAVTLPLPVDDLVEAHGLLYSVDRAWPEETKLRVWRLSEIRLGQSSSLTITQVASQPLYPEYWPYGASSGKQLVVDGTRAFVYLGGLVAQFDLGEPERPRRVLVLPSDAWGLAVDSDRLWLSTPAWLRRLDLKGPEATISRTWLSEIGLPRSAAAAEGWTLVGDYEHGLHVLRGEDELQSAGLGSGGRVGTETFSIDGSSVAASYWESLEGEFHQRTALVDLAASGHVVSAELDFSADRLALRAEHLAYAQRNDYAWVVFLMDLAASGRPRVIASRVIDDVVLSSVPDLAWVDGRLWVVASLTSGVTRLMALSKASGGVLRREMVVDVPLLARDVELAGGHAFVLGGTELLVLDLRVPSEVRQVTRVDLPSRPVALSRHEGLLFVAYSQSGGMRNIRIKPGSPAVRVPTADGGVLVLDISRPATPVEVARVEVPFGINAVAFDGAYLTLVSTMSGIIRLLYAGPKAPSPEGHMPYDWAARRLWLPWLEHSAIAP